VITDVISFAVFHSLG